MINHYNHSLRENLIDYAGCYLIKSDLFSRVIIRGGNRTGRTFGTGIVKEKDDNRGRPRLDFDNPQTSSGNSATRKSGERI